MTERQIKLVEASWDYIIMNSQRAGLLFYERLFQSDPSLRSLFPEDMSLQASKLVAMITFVVHKLDNLNAVLNDVRALGKRHKNYRVEAKDYKTVGDTLLWTLQDGMGEEWTNEHKQAWMTAYSLLSETMIAAAEDQD
jgi:hemoglobin-like flavoprotein